MTEQEPDSCEEKVRQLNSPIHEFFSVMSCLLLQTKYISPISHPLASTKGTKRIYKLVRKASHAKIVRRGVKEVAKALKKGEKGFCAIAGDISPIEVICHLPIMCEDRQVPYLYVPSKHELGAAAGTKRPTSCILVSPKKNFSDMSTYEKVVSEAQASDPRDTQG